MEIVSLNSKKCLDVYYRSTDSGTPIIQWECNKGLNQMFAFSQESVWGDSKAKLSSKVLFKTSTYTQAKESDRQDLMSDNVLTPLVHFGNYTYFVWTDTTARPMVTKISDDGTNETAPLDSNPDYRRSGDGHGRYSMGIDKDGYIHIVGDMHNYTEGTEGPYLPRYQKQTILYWKSKAKESVKEGFSFVGGKGASTAIPGTGWTYCRFMTDNDKELFFTCRVKAINGGHLPGEIGLGLYRYDTSKSTWSALGAKADHIRTGPYYTYYNVIMWENGGFAPLPNAWFQGMMPILKFDLNNNLHMASSINTDPTLAGNNRVIYAKSLDGGFTWLRANGSPIPATPVRGADNSMNVGDVVYENKVKPDMGLFTSVLTDGLGRTGVLQDGVWRVWNGKNWSIEPSLAATDHAGALAPNGSMVFIKWGAILHTAGFGEPVYSYTVPNVAQLASIDENGLKNQGVVYVVGFTPGKREQVVIKVEADGVSR